MKKIILVSLLITASLGAMDSEEKFREFDSAIVSRPKRAIALIPGMDVNHASPSYCGQTPLHLACVYSKTQVVEALIQAGANVDALDTKGKTPLDYALGFVLMPDGDMGMSYVENSDESDSEEFSGENNASPDIVTLLVAHKATISSENKLKIIRLIPGLID